MKTFLITSVIVVAFYFLMKNMGICPCNGKCKFDKKK